ncbi:conserved Plasmodium protein, unknown function [Plasmodium sp. DRC-Itaito]|nr:conserved Plasmodium protein, unknown function [Plasmodium sp. DRC-Itaito]
MRTQSEIIKPLVPLRRIPKNRGTVVRNVTEINPLSEKEIKNVVEVYSEANKAYYKNYLQKERQKKNKNKGKKKKNNLTYTSKKSQSEEFDPLSLNPLHFRNKKFEENGSLLHLPGSNINAKYVPHTINSEYGICSMSYGTLHKSNPLLWGKDYKNHYELPTICSIVKSKHPIYSKPNVAKMFSKLSNNQKVDEQKNKMNNNNNNNNNITMKKKKKKKYIINNNNEKNNNNINLSIKEYPHIDVKKVPTFGNCKEESDFPDLSTELCKTYNDTYTNSNYDESTMQADGDYKRQKNLDNFKESTDEDTYDYSDFFDEKQMDCKNEKKVEINNVEFITNSYKNKIPCFYENGKIIENFTKNNIDKNISLEHNNNNNNNKTKCMFAKSDHNNKLGNKIYIKENIENKKNAQKNYKLCDKEIKGKKCLNQVNLMSTSKKKKINPIYNDFKEKNNENYVLKNEKSSINIDCGDISDKKKKKSPKKKLNKQIEGHKYITSIIENEEFSVLNENINDNNNMSKSRKKKEKGSKKKIKNKNNSNLKMDKYKNSLNIKYFPIKTLKEIKKDLANDTNLSNVIKNYNTKELNKPTIYECNKMDLNKDMETKREISTPINAYVPDNSSKFLKDKAQVKISEDISLSNMYKDKYSTNIYNTNNFIPNKNQIYISRGINNSNIFESQNMGLTQKGYYQLFRDIPKWKVQIPSQICSSGVSSPFITAPNQPLTSIIHSQLSIPDMISCQNSNKISYITPDANALKVNLSSQIKDTNLYSQIKDTNLYSQIKDTNLYSQIKDTNSYSQIKDTNSYSQIKDTNSYSQIKDTNLYSQINNGKSNGISVISEPIILDQIPISNINLNRIEVQDVGGVCEKNMYNMIPWTKSLVEYKNYNNVDNSFVNIEKYSMRDMDVNTRSLYSNIKNDIFGNMVCLDRSYKNLTNNKNDDVVTEKNGLIEENKWGGIYVENNNINNKSKINDCNNNISNNNNSAVQYFNFENGISAVASPSYIHLERNHNLNESYKGNTFKGYKSGGVNDKVNNNMNNTVSIHRNQNIEEYEMDRRNKSKVNELIKISNDNLLNIQKKELLDILNEENKKKGEKDNKNNLDMILSEVNKKMCNDNNVGIKDNCHNNVEKENSFVSPNMYVNPLGISDGNTIEGGNKNNKKDHTNGIDKYIYNNKRKINDCNNNNNNNNNNKGILYSHIFDEKNINDPSDMVHMNTKRHDEKYLN